MASHVKKKRLDYNHKYYQKLQYKRLKSELFNSEYIRNQNARQQKCRRLKAAKQQTTVNPSQPTTTTAQVPSNTAEPPSTARTILRKAEGIRRRRAYTRKMKNENEKLSNEIKILHDETPAVSPAKLFLQNDSPRAKQHATKRLIDKKETLPRGSISKFRKKLSINLSNDYTSSSSRSSTLQNDIEEFLCQDDVTKLAPDKKKNLNGKQIRYLLNHLSTIHQRFILETDNNCHYSTFARYVPDYVLKPSTDDWGTCLCIVCLNPQLKLEKLQRIKFLYSAVKALLPDGLTDITDLVTDEMKTKDFLDDMVKFKDKQFNITYVEWMKTKHANYISHIDRVRQQFRAAKHAKQMAMEQDDTITIHLDWSENFNLKQARQEEDAAPITTTSSHMMPPPTLTCSTDEDTLVEPNNYSDANVTKCSKCDLRGKVAANETRIHFQDDDVTVSIDSTWLTQEFSSLHGVGTIVSAEDPLKALSYGVLSRHCAECADLLGVKKSDGELYSKLLEERLHNGCEVNYDGSSGRMEGASTSDIFWNSNTQEQQRSQENGTSGFGCVVSYRKH
ncbi:hypothetical protein I4U23_005579 [Adineta vaga]|nr:hypothetical protein I4U23_005579 [Adineta vaga]